MSGRGPATSIVVATRDRAGQVLTTLTRLVQLPDAAAIIVVDNGSSDGTAAAVRSRFPDVTVVALAENHGAAARNIGVSGATTPYVAFADDDSWWAPGALARAAEHLDAHPRLGLVAARILVGRGDRLDPTSVEMATSPLGTGDGLAAPGVLGFVACGAVVRRTAFLSVGGFPARYVIGGEEQLLALDLAAAGWELAYLDDVVAHHDPDDSSRRRRLWLTARNDLWTVWLRRRGITLVRATGAALGDAARDPMARRGLLAALWGLPWVLRERRPVPWPVESARRRVEDRPSS
ncbi:MAG: glycosyltransferase [Actinobacteria bacterium]|nr:glycosyltransferase [Actinomycetota bacterium]